MMSGRPQRLPLITQITRNFSRRHAYTDAPKQSTASTMPSVPNVPHLKRFYKHATVVRHPDSDSLKKLLDTEDVNFDNLSMCHGQYWAVALDGRIMKTMYKDSMAIPSRALAVAIAEEWESQAEKIDLKTLHLNQMLARAIRATHDPTLAGHMQSEIQRFLEND
jgi:chaperone required for assembly of F1-ATPase